MRQDFAVDGFRLAYHRSGRGPAVVMLHGWPGGRGDYREVVPLLADHADVITPDLRGFGQSDQHPADPADQYSAAAQARSVAALCDELKLTRPIIAGYDIGSRIAQTLAADRPDLVRALVIGPPLPGIGERILSADAQREFWYQQFHRLGLATQVIDGRPSAVRAYLRHFWEHWSGPEFELPARDLEDLVTAYAPEGAFAASINWYRAGAGSVARSLAERPPAGADRITVPTTVLWPSHDPLFPPEWSDRIDEFFADARLIRLPGAGHFIPLERPAEFAAAIIALG
jgi:pimeloyl-ACP methyl ester carboxylesterase